jgi:DNA-binding IclR family transcriptional regulator
MPRTGQPAIRHVASVQRAVAVLDALADGDGDLGTNEIARRTGINPSTVSRLLATLTDAGFVDHDAASGRYRLGLRLLQLGNAVLARIDLRVVARPHLGALVRATGETATLCAPGAQEAVTVDFVLSPSSVQSVAHIGRPSVAHATAIGKVYLACGGELPPRPLAAYTSRTIIDRTALATEIAETAARGWARAVGEREDDLNAIAAPILGDRGELAAILGVQGPAARFGHEAMEGAVGPLLEHAAAISAELGFRARATPLDRTVPG